MAIKFKKSIADPISVDIGNYITQGRTVSKTVQFSLFTTNENAVWAGNNHLSKESFPFSVIKISVNRNLFRLQVGDPFKLNYGKYGIVGMICRVLLIEEANLQSEKIFLHVMQDVFSVTKAITTYAAPANSPGDPPDYIPVPFTVDAVFEAPYVLSDIIQIVALGKRETSMDLGMQVHMSLEGTSYFQIAQADNIRPYGVLTVNYDMGQPIDSTIGLTISFVESDIDEIETITFQEALSGNLNMLLINDELMTFQTITPISGTTYALTNVIRGRYGTEQENHLINDGAWILTSSVGLAYHSELLPQAPRKFKLLPFTRRYVASIADATEINITPTGKGLTPYNPINFNCNGVSFASRYTGDCVLTWSPRKRGAGAGIGTPGEVLAETDREGTFDIAVWVASSLVRTTTDIDASTWTYTSSMNTTDNGTLATEIEFKITNHRTESGVVYTSDPVSVITKLIT